MQNIAEGKILVLEDEVLVAMALEGALADLGFGTIAATNVAEALEVIEREPLAGALLDLNLGQERSYRVADVLLDRGLPVVFTTGYGDAALEGRYAGVARLAKPFDDAGLRDVLLAARFPRRAPVEAADGG